MIYAMRERRGEPPRVVSMDEAMRLNEISDYGIFRSVNDFYGARKISNLKRIRAWHVDLDGDKKKHAIRINESPIYPSRIVESKNGYHIYFAAKPGASLKYHKIIQEGLIRFFGGDPRAKMVTALLREPNFLHKKDPSNPFKVLEKFNIPVSYTEKEMLYFFPVPEEEKQHKPLSIVNSANISDLTTFLDNLDHEWALSVLSGSSFVGGETYTFKPVSGGKKNIIVNGKQTSCFIDEQKKIGAVPGGPTLFQWLRYFNHSDSKIFAIIKEHFGDKLK